MMHLSSLILNYKNCSPDIEEQSSQKKKYQGFRVPVQINQVHGRKVDELVQSSSKALESTIHSQYHGTDTAGNLQSTLEDSGFHSTFKSDQSMLSTTPQPDLKMRKRSTMDRGASKIKDREIGPCQQICQSLSKCEPGQEMEFYKSIIKQCRMFLQESLLMNDRKRITRIYLKALEKLFRLSTGSSTTMKLDFQPPIERNLYYNDTVPNKDSPLVISEDLLEDSGFYSPLMGKPESIKCSTVQLNKAVSLKAIEGSTMDTESIVDYLTNNPAALKMTNTESPIDNPSCKGYKKMKLRQIKKDVTKIRCKIDSLKQQLKEHQNTLMLHQSANKQNNRSALLQSSEKHRDHKSLLRQSFNNREDHQSRFQQCADDREDQNSLSLSVEKQKSIKSDIAHLRKELRALKHDYNLLSSVRPLKRKRTSQKDCFDSSPDKDHSLSNSSTGDTSTDSISQSLVTNSLGRDIVDGVVNRTQSINALSTPSRIQSSDRLKSYEPFLVDAMKRDLIRSDSSTSVGSESLIYMDLMNDLGLTPRQQCNTNVKTSILISTEREKNTESKATQADETHLHASQDKFTQTRLRLLTACDPGEDVDAQDYYNPDLKLSARDIMTRRNDHHSQNKINFDPTSVEIPRDASSTKDALKEDDFHNIKNPTDIISGEDEYQKIDFKEPPVNFKILFISERSEKKKKNESGISPMSSAQRFKPITAHLLSEECHSNDKGNNRNDHSDFARSSTKNCRLYPKVDNDELTDGASRTNNVDKHCVIDKKKNSGFVDLVSVNGDYNNRNPLMRNSLMNDQPDPDQNRVLGPSYFGNRIESSPIGTLSITGDQVINSSVYDEEEDYEIVKHCLQIDHIPEEDGWKQNQRGRFSRQKTVVRESNIKRYTSLNEDLKADQKGIVHLESIENTDGANNDSLDNHQHLSTHEDVNQLFQDDILSQHDRHVTAANAVVVEDPNSIVKNIINTTNNNNSINSSSSNNNDISLEIEGNEDHFSSDEESRYFTQEKDDLSSETSNLQDEDYTDDILVDDFEITVNKICKEEDSEVGTRGGSLGGDIRVDEERLNLSSDQKQDDKDGEVGTRGGSLGGDIRVDEERLNLSSDQKQDDKDGEVGTRGGSLGGDIRVDEERLNLSSDQKQDDKDGEVGTRGGSLVGDIRVDEERLNLSSDQKQDDKDGGKDMLRYSAKNRELSLVVNEDTIVEAQEQDQEFIPPNGFPKFEKHFINNKNILHLEPTSLDQKMKEEDGNDKFISDKFPEFSAQVDNKTFDQKAVHLVHEDTIVVVTKQDQECIPPDKSFDNVEDFLKTTNNNNDDDNNDNNNSDNNLADHATASLLVHGDAGFECLEQKDFINNGGIAKILLRDTITKNDCEYQPEYLDARREDTGFFSEISDDKACEKVFNLENEATAIDNMESPETSNENQPINIGASANVNIHSLADLKILKNHQEIVPDGEKKDFKSKHDGSLIRHDKKNPRESKTVHFEDTGNTTMGTDTVDSNPSKLRRQNFSKADKNLLKRVNKIDRLDEDDNDDVDNDPSPEEDGKSLLCDWQNIMHEIFLQSRSISFSDSSDDSDGGKGGDGGTRDFAFTNEKKSVEVEIENQNASNIDINHKKNLVEDGNKTDEKNSVECKRQRSIRSSSIKADEKNLVNKSAKKQASIPERLTTEIQGSQPFSLQQSKPFVTDDTYDNFLSSSKYRFNVSLDEEERNIDVCFYETVRDGKDDENDACLDSLDDRMLNVSMDCNSLLGNNKANDEQDIKDSSEDRVSTVSGEESHLFGSNEASISLKFDKENKDFLDFSEDSISNAPDEDGNLFGNDRARVFLLVNDQEIGDAFDENDEGTKASTSEVDDSLIDSFDLENLEKEPDLSDQEPEGSASKFKEELKTKDTLLTEFVMSLDRPIDHSNTNKNSSEECLDHFWGNSKDDTDLDFHNSGSSSDTRDAATIEFIGKPCIITDQNEICLFQRLTDEDHDQTNTKSRADYDNVEKSTVKGFVEDEMFSGFDKPCKDHCFDVVVTIKQNNKNKELITEKENENDEKIKQLAKTIVDEILDDLFTDCFLKMKSFEKNLEAQVESRKENNNNWLDDYAEKNSSQILNSSIFSNGNKFTHNFKTRDEKPDKKPINPSTLEETLQPKNTFLIDESSYSEGQRLFNFYFKTATRCDENKPDMTMEEYVKLVNRDDSNIDNDHHRELIKSYLLLNLYGNSEAKKVISTVKNDVSYFIDISAVCSSSHSDPNSDMKSDPNSKSFSSLSSFHNDGNGNSREACNSHNHTFVDNKYYRDGIEVSGSWEKSKQFPEGMGFFDTHFNRNCLVESTDFLNVRKNQSEFEKVDGILIPYRETELKDARILLSDRSTDKSFRDLKMITLNLKVEDSVVLPDYVIKSPDTRNQPTISYKVAGENFHEELFVLYDRKTMESVEHNREARITVNNDDKDDGSKGKGFKKSILNEKYVEQDEGNGSMNTEGFRCDVRAMSNNNCNKLSGFSSQEDSDGILSEADQSIDEMSDPTAANTSSSSSSPTTHPHEQLPSQEDTEDIEKVNKEILSKDEIIDSKSSSTSGDTSTSSSSSITNSLHESLLFQEGIEGIEKATEEISRADKISSEDEVIDSKSITTITSSSSMMTHPHEGVPSEQVPLEECAFCFLKSLSNSMMDGFTCLNKAEQTAGGVWSDGSIKSEANHKGVVWSDGSIKSEANHKGVVWSDGSIKSEANHKEETVEKNNYEDNSTECEELVDSLKEQQKEFVDSLKEQQKESVDSLKEQQKDIRNASPKGYTNIKRTNANLKAESMALPIRSSYENEESSNSRTKEIIEDAKPWNDFLESCEKTKNNLNPFHPESQTSSSIDLFSIDDTLDSTTATSTYGENSLKNPFQKEMFDKYLERFESSINNNEDLTLSFEGNGCVSGSPVFPKDMDLKVDLTFSFDQTDTDDFDVFNEDVNFGGSSEAAEVDEDKCQENHTGSSITLTFEDTTNVDIKDNDRSDIVIDDICSDADTDCNVDKDTIDGQPDVFRKDQDGKVESDKYLDRLIPSTNYGEDCIGSDEESVSDIIDSAVFHKDQDAKVESNKYLDRLMPSTNYGEDCIGSDEESVSDIIDSAVFQKDQDIKVESNNYPKPLESFIKGDGDLTSIYNVGIIDSTVFRNDQGTNVQEDESESEDEIEFFFTNENADQNHGNIGPSPFKNINKYGPTLSSKYPKEQKLELYMGVRHSSLPDPIIIPPNSEGSLHHGNQNLGLDISLLEHPSLTNSMIISPNTTISKHHGNQNLGLDISLLEHPSLTNSMVISPNTATSKHLVAKTIGDCINQKLFVGVDDVVELDQTANDEKLKSAYRFMNRCVDSKGLHKNPKIKGSAETVEKAIDGFQTKSHHPSAMNTINKMEVSSSKVGVISKQNSLELPNPFGTLSTGTTMTATNTTGFKSENVDNIVERRGNADDFGQVKSCIEHASFNNFSTNFNEHSSYKNYGDPLIIDNGSGMLKIGLSTQEKPLYVPNIVGTENYQKVMPENKIVSMETMVGWRANQYRGVLKLRHPMQNGIIEDWDAMLDIWSYSIEEQLRVNSCDHPLVITENVLTPKQHRERMMEIMMETFDFPAYFSSQQCVMTLYSTGRTTGVVLDSGDTITQFMPVYEGYGINHATEAVQIGGRDVTERLKNLLSYQGKTLATTAEFQIVKEIKEKHCFLKHNNQLIKPATDFELPDGNHVFMGCERYKAPELLFDPSLIGKETPGFHTLLQKSIQKCEIDLREDFYENLIISGGNSLIPGFHERMEEELKGLVTYNASKHVRIHENKHGLDSAWVGASVFTSLSTFEEMLISRDEYFDSGSKLVHMKCF